MALFPRRIRGKYAMISRIDNENLYYMESDDILVWDQARLIEAPKFLWQVMQIGNCGSPIETEAGWLLLTHGVGPMRRYCIGATLLDLDDPCRVIGQTREPLIVPTDEERHGLRSQRRLFVRGVVAQTHADHSLRPERPVDEHGSHRPRRAASQRFRTHLEALHSWVDNMRWVPAPAGRPRGKRTKGRGQRAENGDNPTARPLLACSPAFFPLAFVFRLFPSWPLSSFLFPLF